MCGRRDAITITDDRAAAQVGGVASLHEYNCSAFEYGLLFIQTDAQIYTTLGTVLRSNNRSELAPPI